MTLLEGRAGVDQAILVREQSTVAPVRPVLNRKRVGHVVPGQLDMEPVRIVGQLQFVEPDVSPRLAVSGSFG